MPDPANPTDNGNGRPAGGPSAVAAPAAGRRVLPERRPGRRVYRAARSWARRNFARDRIVSGFRNLLWVAPLTVLIWVYAEREQSHNEPNVTIPIEVITDDPARVVTLQRPSDPLIIATLSGPKAQVDSVIHDLHNLDPHYGAGPVRVPIDRNLGVGERRIDASRIGSDPRFASHGVTVSGCQPAWLDVFIDPIVEQEVEIKAVNKPANVGVVTFRPSTVLVRGPEKVLDSARKADRLVAEANLAGRPELAGISSSPSGKAVSLPDVKLALPIDSRSVSIVGPGVVQAEVGLKADKELTLPYVVPVEVVATSDVLDRYRIKFDEYNTLPNVTVVGPENLIDQMANPEFKPKPVATVEVIDPDDVGGAKTKQVEFKLPPGVSYKSGPNTVTFTVAPRRPGE